MPREMDRERPERPERPEKPERPERPDRERIERDPPDHGDREQPDRDHSERDQTDRSETAAQSEREHETHHPETDHDSPGREDQEHPDLEREHSHHREDTNLDVGGRDRNETHSGSDREQDHDLSGTDSNDSLDFGGYGTESSGTSSETDAGGLSASKTEVEQTGTEVDPMEQTPGEMTPADTERVDIGTTSISAGPPRQPQKTILLDGNNPDGLQADYQPDSSGNRSVVCRTKDNELEVGLPHDDVTASVEGTCQKNQDGSITINISAEDKAGNKIEISTTQERSGEWDQTTDLYGPDGTRLDTKNIGSPGYNRDSSFDSSQTEYQLEIPSGSSPPKGPEKKEASRPEGTAGQMNQHDPVKAPESEKNKPWLPKETPNNDTHYEDTKRPGTRPEKEAPGSAGTPASEPSTTEGDNHDSGVSEIGHGILDVLGMVPLIGEPIDIINAGWYAIEGDMFNASLSMAAAIPGIGNLATGGKLLGKTTKGIARSTKGKEVVEGYRSFEQARNAALREIGTIKPTERLKYIGRKHAGKGKVVGFETKKGVPYKRMRLDWDEYKGPHINVEIGKKAGREKKAYAFPGTEEDYINLLKHLQK